MQTSNVNRPAASIAQDTARRDPGTDCKWFLHAHARLEQIGLKTIHHRPRRRSCERALLSLKNETFKRSPTTSKERPERVEPAPQENRQRSLMTAAETPHPSTSLFLLHRCHKSPVFPLPHVTLLSNWVPWKRQHFHHTIRSLAVRLTLIVCPERSQSSTETEHPCGFAATSCGKLRGQSAPPQ